MRKRLLSVLKVRPEEGRLVLLVAFLFACIQAGQGLGDNAASALFLLRFGVEYLPVMYIAAGLLTICITMAYSTGLSRFDKGQFFPWIITAFAVLLVIERLAILLSYPFLYPAIWLTVTGMGGILGAIVWNLAGEVCDARQAKRLFPLFTSAGILGSVIGNALTGVAAKLLGTDNLFILYAVLLAVAFYLIRTIAASHFPKNRATQSKNTLWEDLRGGFDYVRSSPLLRLVAFSSILFSVLFFSVAFPFNKVITASYPDEAGVAGFLGLFNSVTTAATFLVSLFLANRIYTRLGIINSIFLMPLAYILCFVVFTLHYDLGGAAVARFVQLVVLAGVSGTAWNAMFNIIPSQKRGQVQAFDSGVPSQLGVMISGVLLIIADKLLTVQQIFLMGTLIAVICGVFVWRMRTAYAQALVDALRAGRLEVFSSNETSFHGFQPDASALNVVIHGLQDSRPTTRQLAAEILGKMQASSAIPALSRLLSDPEAAVRTSAIAALGNLQASFELESIIALLKDPEEQVREKALMVVSQLHPSPSASLIENISSVMKDDPAVSVQLQAAATLIILGSEEESASYLTRWLKSSELQIRLSALKIIADTTTYMKSSFDMRLLENSLNDGSPAIRRAAIFALAGLKAGAINETLISHLNDANETVRQAAAQVLRQRGQDSRPLVLAIFKTENPAIDSALDALAPGNPKSLGPLRQFAMREIERARTLRNQLASLPPAGRCTIFLRDQLRTCCSISEGRVIKTIGLFGDMQSMDLVRKSMHGSNPENRAAALEALDTIGDKQLAKNIVSLLEEEPLRSDPSAAIESLLKSTDPWTRVLAVCAIPELELHGLTPQLKELTAEPDALLQEAVQKSLAHFDEVNMDTLNTISILERILLLREIPIFGGLSPEDLKRVAEIAHEQWYPQNTNIFNQGDEGNVMFVIVEGRVQVVRTSDSHEKVLAERGPGDFIGEMAIIDSVPRFATLHTLSDVRMLAIDGLTFMGILRERPEVSVAVLRSLSGRLRAMSM
ncbi:MAG: HEAT repeat domain-containing protein [Chloroflexi bacterium]|nr:HEAT repeat domain-containing protein [Chloroflexota bacterium]